MLQLRFLGTGAADWDPKKASADPAFRRLTAALLDSDLMIDCGPCVYEFLSTFSCPDLLKNVRDLLITHSHGDHFTAESVRRLCEEADAPVTVHGDPVLATLLPVSDKLKFVPVKLFEPFQAGRYTVTALPANHGTEHFEEQPVHYVITEPAEDKTFFWGCDGGWLQNHTYHALLKQKFDAMIFDLTVGDSLGDFRDFEHNSIPMLEEMVRSLCHTRHILKENGQLYACHMARTLHSDHETLACRLSPMHIIPARDNMTIEI